ncbi:MULTISPECIES: hypothetical protein [unclassified Streptomyces]|uniref:hypothetical protein n=1 Tax=unclassified Streptomyces TaxID=2593676 RepID=UPI00166020A6|nr:MULTISPECIES: hypothetical protein [unclassified Streptomyces]
MNTTGYAASASGNNAKNHSSRGTSGGIIHDNYRHTSHFTVVGNHLAQNTDLSLTAIGLSTHIQSVPDGTPVTIKSLVGRFREGAVVIASAMRELEYYGYLRRTRERTPGGKIVSRTVSCNFPAASGHRPGIGRVKAERNARNRPLAAPRPQVIPYEAPEVPSPELGEAVWGDGGWGGMDANVGGWGGADGDLADGGRVDGGLAHGDIADGEGADGDLADGKGAEPESPEPEEAAPETADPDVTDVTAPAGPEPEAVGTDSAGSRGREKTAPRRHAQRMPTRSAREPKAPPRWAAQRPRNRRPALPPVPAPGYCDAELLRQAEGMLARLCHTDPRLLLSAEEAAHLAPGVVAWMEREVPPELVGRALAHALPREPLYRPAAFLAHRLTAQLPPLPYFRTPKPPPPPPLPLQNCDVCDRAYRGEEPGTCGACTPPDQRAKNPPPPGLPGPLPSPGRAAASTPMPYGSSFVPEGRRADRSRPEDPPERQSPDEDWL